MAGWSSIEWTECTWNPVTGCTKISEGCRHCYAERMAKRLRAMGHPNYKNGFKVTPHEQLADLPLRWSKPRLVFVNSMSDLFHEDISADFIRLIFETMLRAKQHHFQVLTKRSNHLVKLSQELPWPSNIWLGVSVETAEHLDRIEHLKSTPAKTKFISLEPLLGPLPKLNLNGVDWVIVGGESGPKARPMLPEWVRSIRDNCQAADVPFFFKQWGGKARKKAGRILDGKLWNGMPSDLKAPPYVN